MLYSLLGYNSWSLVLLFYDRSVNRCEKLASMQNSKQYVPFGLLRWIILF